MSPLRRPAGRGRPAIETRINDAIEGLRPMLHENFGVELLEFQAATGIAVLRMNGDCPDCEMTADTMIHGIEVRLRQQVPEVREVRTLTRSTPDRA
ncbi:MAG: NifU family protein [Gemmatimonadaceae bacterium]